MRNTDKPYKKNGFYTARWSDESKALYLKCREYRRKICEQV